MVVVTWCEEATIGSCLDSVREWADEIVVADMGSPDATASIAREAGARVMEIERHPICEPGRVPAVRAARNDWILAIDADEQVTPGLAARIRGAIAAPTADAYRLGRANLSLSGFAPHEAGFPEYKLRLFRRSAFDIDGYEGRIHTFFDPLPGRTTGFLPASFPGCCLIHYTNPAFEPFLEKVNRYTSQDALARWKDWNGPRLRDLLGPPHIFLRRYLKHGAWRDGWRGFWLCWISFVYESLVFAKLWEMSLHEGRIPDAAMARRRMRELVDRGG